MFIETSKKTGWFHLILIIGATAVSFYFIKEAMAKTIIQWEEVNNVRIAEIQSIINE